MAQAEKKWLPKVCSNCRIHCNEEIKKYPNIRINGRRWIVLERLSITLYVCPKCGLTTVTEEFKDEQAFAKIRRNRIKQRKEVLQQLYSPLFVKG